MDVAGGVPPDAGCQLFRSYRFFKRTGLRSVFEKPEVGVCLFVAVLSFAVEGKTGVDVEIIHHIRHRKGFFIISQNI